MLAPESPFLEPKACSVYLLQQSHGLDRVPCSLGESSSGVAGGGGGRGGSDSKRGDVKSLLHNGDWLTKF